MTSSSTSSSCVHCMSDAVSQTQASTRTDPSQTRSDRSGVTQRSVTPSASSSAGTITAASAAASSGERRAASTVFDGGGGGVGAVGTVKRTLWLAPTLKPRPRTVRRTPPSTAARAGELTVWRHRRRHHRRHPRCRLAPAVVVRRWPPKTRTERDALPPPRGLWRWPGGAFCPSGCSRLPAPSFGMSPARDSRFSLRARSLRQVRPRPPKTISVGPSASDPTPRAPTAAHRRTR